MLISNGKLGVIVLVKLLSWGFDDFDGVVGFFDDDESFIGF